MTLLFGIEQEFFIFNKDGTVPSNKEIDGLYFSFLKNGYELFEKNENKEIIGIKKTTQFGEILLISEVCTHIIEIVFPPLSKLNNFELLYNEIVTNLITILNESNLIMFYKAILSEFPKNFIIRTSSKTKNRLLNYDYNTKNKYSLNLFLILISSTQIHLNILDNKFYNNLLKYYHFEYLFPLLFSNSSNYEELNAHCIRPLLYKDNYHENYYANSFPEILPNTEYKYSQFLNKSVGFVRDYTLICPRPELQTVEFRTTCTQYDLNKILDIIALRVAIHSLITNNINLKTRNGRDFFYKVCETGIVKKEILQNDYNLLKKSIELIDKQYINHLKKVLNKIEKILIL